MELLETKETSLDEIGVAVEIRQEQEYKSVKKSLRSYGCLLYDGQPF